MWLRVLAIFTEDHVYFSAPMLYDPFGLYKHLYIWHIYIYAHK